MKDEAKKMQAREVLTILITLLYADKKRDFSCGIFRAGTSGPCRYRLIALHHSQSQDHVRMDVALRNWFTTYTLDIDSVFDSNNPIGQLAIIE
ncbi:MAG: hypothetical protein AB8B64_01155 [Granulosicoccus sp.]